MSQRKLLSQQKAYRTKDVQEQKKATEEVMNGLTPLSKEPPDFLDDDAIQEWYRVLPLINELPIKDLDKGLLATYCQTYSNYKNATLKIQEEGMVVVTERGSKLSPNYTIQRDSVNTMNAICPKLGLTVESRLKIMEPKPKQQYDPFSAFFEDGKKPQSVYEEFGMDNND
ncbi:MULTISPECIES: phage terminase small subunit P27 family [Staphylococcus]|uniref:Phage terminase small subunit P27 family n=1 Tax=Staphylococcus cohnii TaxID=29382 RepID=A0A2T4LQP5_9STAP|nr:MULTISPECIES: phage terminase small subunit P27 family [Staphylococcus]MBN6754425.1 phage terminase small subunit P27 family [Staphylococcus saprophyticus]MBN6764406.1 phage terminase small subunit P27 family [Staphylococcus saprophyticus]MBN6769209.1 phage terminase small subunit P27 family [Staphylococcus saprophyticus]MBN6780946.1 phage terminase small subunit P27 family [Staphylococcus saprophyticus]MBN6786168.1 phage terminase small subunit P27 family [Staphylococcus saprophyticus]